MDRELMEMQYRLNQDDQDDAKGRSLNSRFHILFAVMAVGTAALLYFR